MKLFITSITLTVIGCTNPDPIYNPFDNIFEVNIDQLVKDNRDTMNAGCGIF